MEQKKSKYVSMLLMAATAVLWSTGGIFIKQIPWNPVAIAVPRNLTAALMVFCYIKWRKLPFVVSRSSLANGFFFGMVSLTYLVANKLTTAANAIMLQYVSPVFNLIISVLFLRQKCRRIDMAAVTVTLAGISLFFMDQLSAGNMAGNVVALIGGFCWAWAFVIAGEVDEATRMSGILMAQLFSGMVGLPVLMMTDTPLSPVILLSAAGLGILQMGIPYILFGLAVKNCSALMCNLIGTLEPLLNPVWVFLFHGEQPGFYAILGSCVVVTVVTAWCALGQKQPQEELETGREKAA